MPLKNDEIDISFHLFLEGPVPEFEKNIKNDNIKGSFNNYIDKMRWVGGQSNVYVCLRGVGGWSVKCLRRHLFTVFPFFQSFFTQNFHILQQIIYFSVTFC